MSSQCSFSRSGALCQARNSETECLPNLAEARTWCEWFVLIFAVVVRLIFCTEQSPFRPSRILLVAGLMPFGPLPSSRVTAICALPLFCFVWLCKVAKRALHKRAGYKRTRGHWPWPATPCCSFRSTPWGPRNDCSTHRMSRMPADLSVKVSTAAR
jgi:hypothetical protein